jgi:Dolichyl-phosphate-mannose-protein mannosyltransferase
MFKMAFAPVRSTTVRNASFSQRGAAYFGMSDPVECIAAASLFAVMIVFRIANMLYYRFDSDEPQHLHVIWAWMHGLVPYRDLFDNHMPLFHIALAPIFGLIGERATILYWMRFVLLPMYCIAIWCTYRIGTLLFSRRVGVWAVILAGFYPWYHFTSLEFRTDNVWAPLWLLCITILVGGALTVPRALVAGLVLGLCFAVSMKSILFLASLLIAAPIALALVGREKLRQSWVHLARSSAGFLLVTLMVPTVIMIFFALKGIWPEFRYCVFDHNIWAHHIAEGHHSGRFIFIFLIAFPFVIYGARLIVLAEPDPALAFRRGFLLLICGFYLPALYSFWALRTREDYLPYYPLAFVFYTAAILAISSRLSTYNLGVTQILRRIPLPAFIVLFSVSILLGQRLFSKNTAKAETDLLRSILTVTNPGDYVFDCKGETIFRQRCCRPILESITIQQIRWHVIPDNIAQNCIETRTCVAVMMGRTPLDVSNFVRRNYLLVGDELRVAGAFLNSAGPNKTRIDFSVVIPASYEIIARDSQVTGWLDGTPYNGARFLEPGKHTFVQTSKARNLAVLWAQAADRHFTPFNAWHSSAGG